MVRLVPVRPPPTEAPPDTVYLQPESDGGVDEAYFMGRILKFAVDDKGHHTCLVGWFYRTRDISMRRRGDSRMLVATMHSDWNPIESIRGKCTIRHRQHIDDLEAYKMQDDCFYYEQLYDRFTQRFYDVVPMESVRTLPPDTMESLKAFDFIVTDAGKGTDFTSMEVCTTCSAGAVPTDSVQCVDCARVYHMRCLDPPLLRKPGKGFAWTCVQCLQKKQILYSNNGTASSGEVADQIPRPAKEKPSFSRGQKKATPATRAPIDKNRRRPLWPFRYVGDYARFREVLSDADDDTIIYPRAASRIGKKYQADLPEFGAGEPVTAPVLEEVTMPQAPLVEEGAEAAPGEAPDAEDDAPASGRVSPPNAAQGGEYRARGRIPLWRKRLIMQQEAKESPIEGSDIRQDLSEELAFSLPEDAREEDFDRFFDECLQNLPGPNRVDFLDRSLLELHRTGYDLEEAAVAAKSLTPGDVDLAEWTPEEVQLFEDGVARLGHDLFGISKELSSKRRRDIVQFFYLWKKTPRYIPVYSMYCRKHRPNKRFKKTTEEAEPADVVMKDADDQAAQTEQYCTNCWTTTPPILLASIRGQDKTTICKRCLEYWLRYAVNRHVSDGTKRSNRDDSGRDAPQGGSGQGKRGGRKANKVRSDLSSRQLGFDGVLRRDPSRKSKRTAYRAAFAALSKATPIPPCSPALSALFASTKVMKCAPQPVFRYLIQATECYGAEPPDEDSPWFCARCKFSRENTDTVVRTRLARNGFEVLTRFEALGLRAVPQPHGQNARGLQEDNWRFLGACALQPLDPGGQVRGRRQPGACRHRHRRQEEMGCPVRSVLAR
ncbi:BAH domain-containing protein [Hyaloraphidium curvatum]|nr:BAH domain-containing protein [Hyaloraphidium curvatum]